MTARDGSAVVGITASGVPGDRTATLFEWLRGRPLRDRLTPERARRIGRLAAALHAHGASWAPPAEPRVLVADRVLYWTLEPRLATRVAGGGALLVGDIATWMRSAV